VAGLVAGLEFLRGVLENVFFVNASTMVHKGCTILGQRRPARFKERCLLRFHRRLQAMPRLFRLLAPPRRRTDERPLAFPGSVLETLVALGFLVVRPEGFEPPAS
jgi:hypothetical protein